MTCISVLLCPVLWNQNDVFFFRDGTQLAKLLAAIFRPWNSFCLQVNTQFSSLTETDTFLLSDRLQVHPWVQSPCGQTCFMLQVGSSSNWDICILKIHFFGRTDWPLALGHLACLGVAALLPPGGRPHVPPAVGGKKWYLEVLPQYCKYHFQIVVFNRIYICYDSLNIRINDCLQRHSIFCLFIFYPKYKLPKSKNSNKWTLTTRWVPSTPW